MFTMCWIALKWPKKSINADLNIFFCQIASVAKDSTVTFLFVLNVGQT